MHRLTRSLPLALLVLGASCGGSQKPADSSLGSAPDDRGVEQDGGGPNADAATAAKDECVGFDIGNLEEVLLKSSCEVTANPESLTAVDLKGKLEVKVTAMPTKLSVGGKTDLLVTYANKSKAPLVLHFKIDPVARFETEAWDQGGAKGKAPKRVDMPAGPEPAPPKGVARSSPTDARSARITLVPGGTARAHLSWEAVKTKWAPEKYLGAPPERGFPRSSAGPLPKGKYTVKVVTPLVGVADGEAMTAPKVDIEIGP